MFLQWANGLAPGYAPTLTDLRWLDELGEVTPWAQ